MLLLALTSSYIQNQFIKYYSYPKYNSTHTLHAVSKSSTYLPQIPVNSARKVCQNERKRKGGKALICRTLPPNLLICNLLPFIFQTRLCQNDSRYCNCLESFHAA